SYELFARQEVRHDSPVVIALHVATPLPAFVDRGKAMVALTPDQTQATATSIVTVTNEWQKARRADRDAARRFGRLQQDIEKQVAAAERRQRERDKVVGTGVLHQVLASAASEAGTSINKLTVLSTAHDPFRRDTRDGHIEGQWFAEQIGPH